MARFGKETIGGSNTTVFLSWQKLACRFQAPEDGDVTSLSWYGKVSQGGQDIYGVLYGDSVGSPGALLGTSSPVQVGTSPQWWTFTFGSPIPITGGAYYWLCILFHAYSPTYYYDAGASNQWCRKQDTYPPDDPFGSPDEWQDREMSIYATYTPAAPPPAVGGETKPYLVLTL